MKSKEVRQSFLKYFQSKNHHICPSAPLILKDDPTLMFTNSGMNQFKDIFLGYKKAEHTRIADSQKCLRVSGKHNDLDDVGKDTYHHTLFEMLGNWSFGDYFKQEAIDFAWEFLTQELKINPNNLFVTVFEGDTTDNLSLDEEAQQLWKKHLPNAQILLGNKKDNFWEMGDQGPCGPCSEIHIDIRTDAEKEKIPGVELVNKDHPQVVEIWNLVFMEYLRKADGSLETLPHKHIDTGMGFERLCMVMQGKTSNYDTDVFAGLIAQVEKISGKTYGASPETDIAIRVVVDHIRAIAFSIADGQLPSNTGAGYVIRRILRRAVNYSYRFLDMGQPLLFQLVDVLAKEMGDSYPELTLQKKLITEVIKEEEHSFLRTIEQGLSRLDEIISHTKDKTLSGSDIFQLYDTYGFPLDLSQLIAEEKGFSIDIDGFNTEMAQQKNRAKQAASMETSDWTILNDNPETQFVGYDLLEENISITAWRKVSKKDTELYQLVFDKTPFYAESGGQIGDTGWLILGDEKIEILSTSKENNRIIHTTQQLPSQLNATFKAVVDAQKRAQTQKNHSATHLLHQALRSILGTHVEQKGSFVGPDYLRFDFTHFQKLSEEEIQQIETFVNDKINDKISLQEFRNIPMQKAMDMGAIALFGEKYGDEVRAIQFGESVELCGGTHVPNTQDIFYCKIVSEGSSSAGIRRIEAITGEAVKSYFNNLEQQWEQLKVLLKNPPQPIQQVEKVLQDNAELQKEVEHLHAKEALQALSEIQNDIETINGVDFLAKEVQIDPKNLKNSVFDLLEKHPNLLVVFTSIHNDKPMVTVGIGKELATTKGWKAGDLVKELAQEIKGGGGGSPTYATAGGKDVSGLPKVLEKAKALL